MTSGCNNHRQYFNFSPNHWSIKIQHWQDNCVGEEKPWNLPQHASAEPARAQLGGDQHSQVSQGACWYKQQVSPVWYCQTKACSGSASVLWLQLPVTKPRSQGVKRGNSPVRLKNCQCWATTLSTSATSTLCGWKLSRDSYLKQNASIWTAHWQSSGDHVCIHALLFVKVGGSTTRTAVIKKKKKQLIIKDWLGDKRQYIVQFSNTRMWRISNI